ncbi:MAG TPA: ABC transporter substrate-binding protein, partial [Amycolatopsis sp.]|nr:ABC transporter substrate-binding protein [Amycolatopsis sp.]
MVVSACGSSSSGGGANDPIVVMVMGTFQAPGTDMRDASAAVQAKAAVVNAAGGIKGRQLKVEVCDDQENPNQATTCARNAVSEHATVVISSTQSTGFGAQTLPVLQAAKIPVVGEPAVVPTDWTSQNVFPLDPGEPAQYAGVALALKGSGCVKVGSVQLPVSSAVAAV